MRVLILTALHRQAHAVARFLEGLLEGSLGATQPTS